MMGVNAMSDSGGGGSLQRTALVTGSSGAGEFEIKLSEFQPLADVCFAVLRRVKTGEGLRPKLPKAECLLWATATLERTFPAA